MQGFMQGAGALGFPIPSLSFPLPYVALIVKHKIMIEVVQKSECSSSESLKFQHEKCVFRISGKKILMCVLQFCSTPPPPQVSGKNPVYGHADYNF